MGLEKCLHFNLINNCSSMKISTVFIHLSPMGNWCLKWNWCQLIRAINELKSFFSGFLKGQLGIHGTRLLTNLNGLINTNRDNCIATLQPHFPIVGIWRVYTCYSFSTQITLLKKIQNFISWVFAWIAINVTFFYESFRVNMFHYRTP